MIEPQPRTIQVNGTELTYVERGDGDPVVFVHGSLSDLRAWALQMAQFAHRYRTIAYSRRCHWPNAWHGDDAECDIAVHAADLGALIDALGLDPPHLVGSSYGAMTALTLAAMRPGLPRTLVLGEPPLIPWLMATPDGQALFASFEASAWQPARQACGRQDLEAGARLFIDGVIGEGAFDQLPPPARAMIKDNALEMGLELETVPQTYFPALSCEDARRVQTPVLLVTGEVSPQMFHRITDELARCLPAAERAVIRVRRTQCTWETPRRIARRCWPSSHGADREAAHRGSEANAMCSPPSSRATRSSRSQDTQTEDKRLRAPSSEHQTAAGGL